MMSLLSLTEQGDGLEGLCLPHFNDIETSVITLTDKVISESSVVCEVDFVNCCLWTRALPPSPPPPPPLVKPIAGFVIFVFHQKIENTSVAAQARAIDRIFEILIVGAKPRHSGQAAGEKQ